MLPALKELLDNSLNTLGIANSDDLVDYCLIRTLTDIKTIKSISEEILEIHRTTIIKKLQKPSEIENCFYAQLLNLPVILNNRKFKFSIIIDSTLLRRYSKNVFSSSIRYNYVENHKKLYQEQINCCIFNKKKGL
ncbi:hypothetical protein ACPB8Q_08000 (plasmid) [Methanocaldococcus indicus]|uniref:hypothetical protein n=1 Tax=Methanocaldococcus indicus TaxID=213231 RepID=UPI0039C9D3A0